MNLFLFKRSFLLPLILGFVLVVALCAPLMVDAQQFGGQTQAHFGGQTPGSCGCTSGLCNPLKFCSISAFIAALLRIVATIAFPIIVLFMIYAGFLFVSARGNPDKLTEAKRIFLWTLIGALIILGAEAISIAIQRTVKDIQGNVITS